MSYTVTISTDGFSHFLIDALFQSSCSQVLKKNPDRLKRMLNLRFDGEEGMVCIIL
jgi:hypothetical protein